ncbi:MAG: DUF3536 domain-containing protein [Candidatus Eisenbacteria bacterium]|nr:DUF3536 domain-containing protein [Candidatus Eisenbacteria bacterium]
MGRDREERSDRPVARDREERSDHPVARDREDRSQSVMNVVIHGHFYQPPRFNPWTGEIPRQESAAPAHDWNARVADECYRPNGASRVRGEGNRIVEIVNNYAYMSFDFGPTLLSWLARHEPQTYERVRAGDQRSRELQQGHGNAIAHAYNHMILPLANRRDKHTQIRWGLRDFASRFGRQSESLWLPETAIDRETAELLIEEGVRYVILAPGQARRVRPKGRRNWTDVQGGRIDPRRAYLYRPRDARRRVAGERSLAVFFYDGPLAGEVSFGHLLRSAPHLGERLREASEGADPVRGLVSVATDGEVYGHHEPFADMCFSYFARREAPGREMRLTNYGRLLAEHPPEDEVELEFGEDERGTSWSCAHGVGRWMHDCGCSTGAQPGWNQAWRAPLRESFDRLRDRLAEIFESQTADLLRDPWAARDDYVEILLDSSPDARRAFLDRHAAHLPRDAERVRIWRLLESQRYAMYMFTSCGWFFADISGIETVQNLAYAARAIELAQAGEGEDLEALLLEGLAEARSNLPEMGTGADVFLRFVRPQAQRTQIVAGEVGLTTILCGQHESAALLGHELLDWRVVAEDAGDGGVHAQLAMRDPTIEERSHWWVHAFGGQSPAARVYVEERRAEEETGGALPSEEMLRGREGIVRLELRDLVSEQREHAIRAAFRETLIESERAADELFDRVRRLMETLRVSGLPVPAGLRANGRDVIARRIERLARRLAEAWRRSLAGEQEILADAPGPESLLDRVAALLDFARSHALEVPTAPLARAYGGVLEQILREVAENPDTKRIERLVEIVRTSYPLQFPLDRRPLEDLAFEALRRQRARIRADLEAAGAQRGETAWEALAESLGLGLMEILDLRDDVGDERAALGGAGKDARR